MLDFQKIIDGIMKRVPGISHEDAMKLIREELDDVLAQHLVLRYWDRIAEQRIRTTYPKQLEKTSC